MRTVFLDSVGLIASWNDRDQWHNVASFALEELITANVRLVTTEAILFETANALARSPHRRGVALLKKSLEQAEDLIIPTIAEMEQAWREYETGGAASAGIVDHISFQIMRRLGVTEALTNDAHFKAAGFVALF